jgi:hypothetical protein
MDQHRVVGACSLHAGSKRGLKVPVMTQSMLPSTAKWLSLRVEDDLPSEWHALANDFVRIALVTLGSATPRRMLIGCNGRGDHLRIRVAISADIADAVRAALLGLADRFMELSRFNRPPVDRAAAKADPFEELAILTEWSDPEAMEEDAGAGDSGPQIQVFDWNPVADVTGGADRGRHDEAATRMAKAIKRLRATKRTRPRRLPPATWPQLLEQLEERFPNFAAVVGAVIRPHVALSARGLQHRMPPLLLVGPPGIGKTYFAKGLCEVLGVPQPLFISIASETNGSALGGSSTFWSNSSPGKIFESLAWGHRGGPAVANGLVVVDEVDKVRARDYDPLGALYDLLEADTAQVFVDQSLPDVTIDASHLRIVCTANDLAVIPLPIRSRLLVFEIEAPAPGQAAEVVRNIFAAVVERLGSLVSSSLPQAVVDEAAQMEPRQVRLLLEGAVASAMTDGRDRVDARDWHAVRGAGRAAVRRVPMGFVARV